MNPAPTRLAARRLRAIGRWLRLLVPAFVAAGLVAACGGTDETTTSPAGATVRATMHATSANAAPSVQYVRLVALSEVNGNPWTSMAEFNLVDLNGATLSRTGWNVTADSQELVGENGAVTNAIDGDPNSYWHTQWYAASPMPPHTFTVNLGSPAQIGGFRYLPRQVGVNGRIANYQFFTSNDGNNWTLVAQGTFQNTGAEATVLLYAAPTLTAIADRTDPANQPVNQAVAATDPSGYSLTYSASGLPSGLAIDPSSGLIAGTPTVPGIYAVTIQVTDGRATTTGTFNWTIAAVGGVGITARYVRLQALSEVNGNPWTSVAEFNVLDSGGSLIPRTGWTASADSQELVGENGAVSNAIDGDPNSYWHTQWFTTSPPPPHALTVDLGAVRSISGFKYLPRQVGVNGRIASYRFYTSTDAATWVLVTSGVFPNSGDEQTVHLTAPTNQPPVLAPVSNRSDPIGQSVTQAVLATDPDGNSLTYSATGLPNGLAIDSVAGTISGTPTASGTFAVTVTVGDGHDTASTSFTWTITPANHPPVIAPVSGRVDITGTAVTQAVVASDADGDPLTFSASGLPTGVGIDPASGTMSGTPTAAGTFTVVVTVSDGRASASTSFAWLITANHPPVLAPLSGRTDVAGQSVTQAVSATDADGDTLTYSATGLPTGVGINAATGTMSGTPTVPGTFTVVVTVSDGRANTSGMFTWIITAAPSASGGTTASYVRLVALSEINGNPWTSMAEFNLIDPNGVTLSRSGWTVVADSQELVGENGAATNAIDGDPNSYWHTQWYSASPPPPHTFTVNLGGPRLIGGFKYLPRQIGVNGRIANYQFYTSNDGVSWQLITQGTFAPDSSEKTTTFPTTGVNHPPTMTTLPSSRTDVVGSAVTLALVATDPDGDPLTYSATGLPAGLAINPASGIISGTPTQATTYATTVSVSDGRGGSAQQTFTWIVTSPPPPAPTSPGASGVNPPIVFNASTSAAAGDVVSLQGVNFGTAPTVYFDGYPATPLTIVDSVGTTWLAVQIPPTATGALILRINNGTGISAAIKLNAARPYHLDTTELHPGGPFRLYGRNLIVAGSIPTVTVNGLAASVDVVNSTEHLLLVTMPTASQPSSSAAIVVDNGNGSGPAQLDRTATIVNSGSGDPFSLGVGWGASFSAIAANPIYPATDPRIGNKAMCNGSNDDGGAIQAAIDLASSLGGGVVQLPAGRCAYSAILTLRSNVVVRGAGKTSTELYHTVSNYPAIGQGVDLSGLIDLTLTNSQNGDSMLFKDSTRIFLKNVAINIGTSNQMYLSGNVNFVFANTDVVQTGNGNEQGPYTLDSVRGLVFEGNTTTWVSGAPTFGKIHDSSIRSSHFSRNATNQNTPGAVHCTTLDFAYRVSVIGNLWDVIGGPITNTTRNDGETILTEGGGANRTENYGTVGSATSTTMTDPANTLNTDPFGTGVFPEDYGIAIVAGTGAGQMRHIVAYSGNTATVDHPWDVIPDGSSRYATSVFGLEQALIEGNTLSQNPRGIWLYNTSMRDIDVIGNTISEGGGIYVRVYQNLATRTFTPIYGVLIKGNQISNTTRNWMSYINVVLTNGDGSAFGTGTIGIEIRNNVLTANRPNVYSNQEEYAGTEGMMDRMPLESGGYYESTTIPRLLGTIFDGNTCTYCDVGIRLGTGANGTVINNTKIPGTTTLYTDTSSVPTGETSTATVVR